MPHAIEEAKSDPNFRPVSDQALLATMELAVCCCPREDTHWINKDPLRLELTHVLLSFQSKLFSRQLEERANQSKTWEGLGKEGWAEFIRNNMAHNTGRYWRNALGRLYAMCCIPEIAGVVSAGKTAHGWFVETFELTPVEYVGLAMMSGGPSIRLNRDAPDAGELFFNEKTVWNAIREEERVKLHRLLGLATGNVGDVVGVPDGEIDDFVFSASRFYRSPVLNLGDVSICVSPDLMMSKFIFGIPYLAQEAVFLRLGRTLTDEEVKGCRAPFGYLFENYVAWFTRLVLPTGRCEILTDVHYGPKNEFQSDVIIIRGNMALVLEAKTTMASLAFRHSGSFESLDAMLEVGARQAYSAARALRTGKASRKDGSVIEGVHWVIPCVVTYDRIPLFEPIAEFYERHLETKTELPLFQTSDGIEPVQFFDVDFLESWETEFDLRPESGAVFGYLVQRARKQNLRYGKVQPGLVAAPLLGAPKPFSDFIKQAHDILANKGRTWFRPNS